MFNLPTDIINLIYEFDGTKRLNFDKVLEEFKEKIIDMKDDLYRMDNEMERNLDEEGFDFWYFNYLNFQEEEEFDIKMDAYQQEAVDRYIESLYGEC